MAVLEFKPDTPETTTLPAAISVRNVLYATDFSSTSEAALPYATGICRKFGGTLHVAHVLSDTGLLLMTGAVDYVTFGTLYEDAHAIAREKVGRVTERLSGIPFRSYVRHGNVWENLGAIVAENGIDLIVVGTHGRTGFGKILVGSVAEDILRHAPCPVLTVGPCICGRARLPQFDDREGALAPLELEMKHILCAANFSSASRQAASVALALAQEFRTRLTLMHVIEQYAALEEEPGPIEQGVRRLQSFLPGSAALAQPAEIVIELGAAPQRIVNKATELEADLIVLGAHAADHTAHVPWSTVTQVAAHAHCPVLTVRA